MEFGACIYDDMAIEFEKVFAAAAQHFGRRAFYAGGYLLRRCIEVYVRQYKFTRRRRCFSNGNIAAADYQSSARRKNELFIRLNGRLHIYTCRSL